MTASAVQGLGALFRSQEPLPDSADAALLAFCAVGRVLGMEIKAPRAPEMAVPAGSEAPSEPFETIARATHLRVRPVRLRGGWWQQDNGPLLAYRKDGHFPVALLPRGAGSYNCFDPSSRSHSPVTAANEDRYERRAFQPYRSLPTGPVTTLDLFKFALAGRGRDLAGIILLGTVIALLGMASVQAIGLIADHAIPRGDRSLLGQIGLGVVIAALGLVVAEATRGILVIRLGAAADHTLQTAVWDRLLSLRIPFFRREPSGDILIRVSAISQIHAILSGATLRTVLTSIFGLLNLGLLWAYSWHLALLGVIIAGGVAAVTLVG
ncbi:MAG: ABC transporter transmembrane domain-containing protein, partial [Spirochaetia bacterium]